MANSYSNSFRYSIQSIAPTICELLGIESPAQCACEAIVSVTDAVKKKIGDHLRVDRILVYAPDAIGDHLRKDYIREFQRINTILPIKVPMTSVVPPKTPVAFASMFTGAPPEVHRITKYERFVLTCDTLFDAVSRAGLRTAIVAVAGSSIDIIFRDRNIDYFTEADDSQVISRSLELIKGNEHNLIVTYNQEYDDALHVTNPFSDLAEKSFKEHVKSLEILCREAESAWGKYNRVIAFTPDHGAHIDAHTGRGDHSLDIPEDMNLSHYFSINSAQMRG
jgi:hypothetical protein